jgi:hypothetical protein
MSQMVFVDDNCNVFKNLNIFVAKRGDCFYGSAAANRPILQHPGDTLANIEQQWKDMDGGN